jgi:hypothetical protein
LISSGRTTCRAGCSILNSGALRSVRVQESMNATAALTFETTRDAVRPETSRASIVRLSLEREIFTRVGAASSSSKPCSRRRAAIVIASSAGASRRIRIAGSV